MNMKKKYTLRDEYEKPNREELKAFADEINKQGESKRLKGADAEKARKTGQGFARTKIYKFLDNGKFEGRIYNRTEKLNISNENNDIRMLKHPGKFDGYNGASQKPTDDAPAYIKPSMIEFKGNAKLLDEINTEEIQTTETDTCISTGKWNGEYLSQEKYDEINNKESIIELWKRTGTHEKTLFDDDGTEYTKTYRIRIREYDAGNLATILTKKYEGIPLYRDTEEGKEKIKPNKLMPRKIKGCKHPTKEFNGGKNITINYRERHPTISEKTKYDFEKNNQNQNI